MDQEMFVGEQRYVEPFISDFMNYYRELELARKMKIKKADYGNAGEIGRLNRADELLGITPGSPVPFWQKNEEEYESESEEEEDEEEEYDVDHEPEPDFILPKDQQQPPPKTFVKPGQQPQRPPPTSLLAPPSLSSQQLQADALSYGLTPVLNLSQSRFEVRDLNNSKVVVMNRNPEYSVASNEFDNDQNADDVDYQI